MAMLTLACPIESRDGTLTKDSKLLNCYWEGNSAGKRVAVKRPGYYQTGVCLPGAAQGMLYMGAVPYAITNDIVQLAQGSGVAPIGLPGVTIPGERMTVLSSILQPSGANNCLIKSPSALWFFPSLATITKVTDADYPSSTVPGIAYLDGTYYVMTPAGSIQGSDLEDPTSWNALNFIGTDRGIGRARALGRHLNYIVAFCAYGVQFFYDAANPAPGSPLLPSGNTLTTVGCPSPESIQNLNDMTLFLSQGKQKGRSVSAFSGLSLQTLSTPAIDRVLNRSNLLAVYSFTAKVAGQSFYLLTLSDLNLTLCLNLTTGDWSQWSSSTDNITDNKFCAGYSTGGDFSQYNLVLDLVSGAVYAMDPATYQDNLQGIRALIRTRTLDHDSNDRKNLPSLGLIGDSANATISVRYSNDDYGSWSAPRTIDLSLQRKQLTALGSFYQRSFEFLHTANTPLRLEGYLIPDESAPMQAVPGQ